MRGASVRKRPVVALRKHEHEKLVLMGTGGVGSICGERLARGGVRQMSAWDPDIVNDVNINRFGVNGPGR